MDFQHICNALEKRVDVASCFSHTDVVRYIEIIALLKPTPALAYLAPSHLPSTPPESLPANVHEFLRACFDIPDETAKWAWEIFRHLAWAFNPGPEEQSANRLKHIKLFLVHGIPLNIGVYSLSPPTRVCLDPDCCRVRQTRDSIDLVERELVEAKTHRISVFTLDLGAVPGFSTSSYCRNCNTRYYPNYYVHSNATTRTYYYNDNQVPEFIESSKHFYVSAKLCELFTNMMVSAWTSGTNCARIYNTSISQAALKPLMPQEWTSLEIDVEDVFNGFFLNALLLDHLRDKFCTDPKHHALQSQCSIVDCTAEASIGFRTCSDPDHRAMELHHYQRGKAMFQLKERLQRAKGFAPSNAFPNPTMPSTSRLPTSQDEITATGVNLLPDNSAESNNGDDGSDGEEIEYTSLSRCFVKTSTTHVANSLKG
ncbi:hypothetical protein R3P38DRAFT_2801462 [Favolaschia claudopus]|uniref:CxC5 like cysteine cluster associated with KDZ domain-containing protein n=1 Tax=Favolaschia claudopus TaxID=2862362 RepID=A0AAV9ZVN5_9AGAR